MKLLGDRNWYLPRWLAWLPNISVETRHERPPEDALVSNHRRTAARRHWPAAIAKGLSTTSPDPRIVNKEVTHDGTG
jgi:hypothetical protein